jgi:hypothetical protein
VRTPDLLAIYSPGRREERAEADRWFQSAPHAWIEIETARVRDDDDRIEREGFLPVRGGRRRTDRGRWDLLAIQFLGQADDPSPPPNILTGPYLPCKRETRPNGPY